eukprot:7264540-Prymnesium_polylepis.1
MDDCSEAFSDDHGWDDFSDLGTPSPPQQLSGHAPRPFPPPAENGAHGGAEDGRGKLTVHAGRRSSPLVTA